MQFGMLNWLISRMVSILVCFLSWGYKLLFYPYSVLFCFVLFFYLSVVDISFFLDMSDSRPEQTEQDPGADPDQSGAAAGF
jgi:hypothetical protein